MPKDRVTDLLEEFVALTRAAARPESPARRTAMRNRLPAGTLTGAALIVVAVAVLGIVAGRPAPSDLAGASATPSASSGPVAIASPAPLASTEPSTPTATPAERPTPTPEPTVGPCNPADLATRITLWEGAAGSRIADLSWSPEGLVLATGSFDEHSAAAFRPTFRCLLVERRTPYPSGISHESCSP